MKLEKINPLEYITDRDPIPETVMDSSAWFKTETIEINVGEWSGRPTKEIMLRTSMLNYYFANGWYISEVLDSREGGKWITAATARAMNHATSNSVASSSSSSNGTSQTLPAATQTDYPSSTTHYPQTTSRSVVNAPDGEHSLGPTTTITTNDGYSVTTPGRTVKTSPTSPGTGTSNANGSTSSQGASDSTGSSESKVETEGTPWWYAYQRLRLKRRKMQSELVLKDMIASFTKAYNEGRQINDERYDELVALYSIMLSRTEDEANAFAGLNADDFKPLADAVVAACRDAMEKYGAAADGIPDDWMQSRIDEINRKFDALLSKARTDLVDKGLYNSTIWPTTASGIERDRQIALNDLKDEMVTMKVDVYGKIAAMKADIGQKLLDCEIRIIEAQQKMLLGPTEVRNTVFKWMLEFMERREDDYPGLDQLATIAEKLGYAEGSFAGAEAK